MRQQVNTQGMNKEQTNLKYCDKLCLSYFMSPWEPNQRIHQTSL